MLNAATMTEDEISREVIAILATHLKQDPESWSRETVLADLGIDSFDFIEFVFLIEDKFGIVVQYNANDADKTFTDVGSVAAAIRQFALREAQAPAQAQPAVAAPQGAVGLA